MFAVRLASVFRYGFCLLGVTVSLANMLITSNPVAPLGLEINNVYAQIKRPEDTGGSEQPLLELRIRAMKCVQEGPMHILNMWEFVKNELRQMTSTATGSLQFLNLLLGNFAHAVLDLSSIMAAMFLWKYFRHE